MNKKNSPERINKIISNLLPNLKNGSIILSSTYNSYFFFISPSSIRHGSVCIIEDEKYFVIEINERGFTKYTLANFLKNKDEIYVLDHKDETIMSLVNNFIYQYKDYSYGFFSGRKYCFEFIFDIFYRAAKTLKKEIDIPCFYVTKYSYFNSGSIMFSDDFILKYAIIFDRYVEFKKKKIV